MLTNIHNNVFVRDKNIKFLILIDKINEYFKFSFRFTGNGNIKKKIFRLLKAMTETRRFLWSRQSTSRSVCAETAAQSVAYSANTGLSIALTGRFNGKNVES